MRGMGRRLYTVVAPLTVNREGFGQQRTMKPNEQLWVETPLGREWVVVYLDNVEFRARRSEFDTATQSNS